MDYKFWENNQGRSPVLEKIEEISRADANSGKSYWLHLEKLKKYSFDQMMRHGLIRKLKGRNPCKIFELRFSLPHKIARTFFVISRSSEAWLLHLNIKKKDTTDRSDIQISEQRATLLDEKIHYL